MENIPRRMALAILKIASPAVVLSMLISIVKNLSEDPGWVAKLVGVLS